MRHLVFDLETDGLLDAVSRIHCLVLRDLESDRVVSCTDSAPGYTSIEEGLSLLSGAEKVYGHNIIRYDLPALNKLRPGFALKGRPMDTFVAASFRWAHIQELDFAAIRSGKYKMPGQFIGRQRIEAWGHRFGVHKVGTEIDDWSKWTPLMQARCESDTLVGRLLVQKIRSAGISMQAYETEHELAEYLFQQERNGWPFDMEKAIKLQAALAAKRESVENELRTAFTPWFAPNGETTPKRDNKKKGTKAGVPYTKLKLVEFNPGSRDHIADRMTKLYGWQPEEFTASGKPQVDENTLKGLDAPPVAKLREYLLLTKRLGQLAEGKEAWFKHVTTDGPEGGKLTGITHIHGGVIQNRAVTHRASHVHPNLAQVPKVGNPYGAECRELFHVPAGWLQLGADASGLELRCLAHYLAKYDSGAYGKLVLEGDVHSVTQEALAEWVDEGKKGRDTSKTWKYAYLYGAGDKKLGKIIVTMASEAKLPELRHWAKDENTLKKLGGLTRARFLNKLVALKYLVEALQNAARYKGYLIGLDGRPVFVRHAHAVLNTLLQSAGALICKRWIVEYNRRLVAQLGLQGFGRHNTWAALGWIHDETQLAVRPEYKDPIAEIVVASIRHMTDYFSFRCPLDGEAKFGRNWKETH